MSLGGLLASLVGLAMMLFGGWLLLSGQPPIVPLIVAAMGLVLLAGSRLSR